MDHEIRLVASLDTSNINTNVGTTGTTNRTSSSGGASSFIASSAMLGSSM